MKYVNVELNSAKFVQPTLMFHGTSFSNAKSILSQGLGVTKNINRVTTEFEPLGNVYLTPRISDAINYARKAKKNQEDGLLVICKTILQDHRYALADDSIIGILQNAIFQNIDIIDFLNLHFHHYLPKSIQKMYDSYIKKDKGIIINLTNKFKSEIKNLKNNKNVKQKFIQENKNELKQISYGLGQFIKYFDPFQSTNLKNLNLRLAKNIATDKQISYRGNSKIICLVKVMFNNDTETNVTLKVLWKKDFDIKLLKAYLDAERIKYTLE